MRQDVKEFANTYQYSDPSTPNALEQMWSDIKQMLSETVEKRVTSKTSAARHTNPWITTSIRRAIRHKQRAHKKARMTGKKKDVDRYRRIQAQTRYEVRQASRKYLEDVVSEDYRTNSKRFWSYVNSKKQEADGVAPLKDKQGFLRSNSQNKAEILGDQFRSVFTEEDTTSIPDKGPSPYPDMPPIRVSEAGVKKLLLISNLARLQDLTTLQHLSLKLQPKNCLPYSLNSSNCLLTLNKFRLTGNRQTLSPYSKRVIEACQ
ncbi:hypothetical protein ACOMHN_032865 [Nucella lapillus]